MNPYFVFISYNFGGHYNVICRSAGETHAYLKEVFEDLEVADKPPTIREIKAIDEDKWFELSDGSWITITNPSQYSLKQIEKIIKS
jgi:hypothetical protein